MILKGFKIKSNQKFINRLLAEGRSTVSLKKIESVGIVFNLDEFDDFEAFRVFFSDLGINHNKIKFAVFTIDSNRVSTARELLFSPKEVGWKGKIKSNELETFLNTHFDTLISYYKQDNLELNLITARSKADFKVGLSNNDERLNDLILDIKPKNFDLFNKELIKYLTILKKI